MKTLVIDTSMMHLQIGLFDQDRCVSLFSKEQKHRLGDILHDTLGNCLQEADWRASDIERIIVTRGPGSFTGVRVGLSAARALALALSIPIYGISTLHAMALSHHGQPVRCAVDTRRKDFFTQSFDENNKADSEIEILEAPALEQDGYELIIDKVIDLNHMNAFFLNQDEKAYESPKPLYVRGADAALPKNLPELDW